MVSIDIIESLKSRRGGFLGAFVKTASLPSHTSKELTLEMNCCDSAEGVLRGVDTDTGRDSHDGILSGEIFSLSSLACANAPGCRFSRGTFVTLLNVKCTCISSRG